MKDDGGSAVPTYRHYPAYSLPLMVASARDIYAKERRSVLSYEDIAKAIGYTSLSGPARQKMSALRKFGLLESVGEGLQLAQLAIRLIHQNENSSDYEAALKEAALRPELFKTLYSTHPHASEDTVRRQLIVKHHLTDEGAKIAAKAFRETISFSNLNDASYPSGLKNGPEAESKANEMNPQLEDPPPALKLPANPEKLHPVGGSSMTFPIAKGVTAAVTFSVAEIEPSYFARLIEYLELAKKSLGDQEAP